jgi:hypothetical protein
MRPNGARTRGRFKRASAHWKRHRVPLRRRLNERSVRAGSARHERAPCPCRRRHPKCRRTTRRAPDAGCRTGRRDRRKCSSVGNPPRSCRRAGPRTAWPTGRDVRPGHPPRRTSHARRRGPVQMPSLSSPARRRPTPVREPLRGRVTPVFAPRALSNGTRTPARLRQARTLPGACPLKTLAAGAQAIVGVRPPPPPPPRDTIADGGDASSDETALASVRARHRAAHDRGRTACAVADSSGPRVLSDDIRAKHQG